MNSLRDFTDQYNYVLEVMFKGRKGVYIWHTCFVLFGAFNIGADIAFGWYRSLFVDAIMTAFVLYAMRRFDNT